MSDPEQPRPISIDSALIALADPTRRAVIEFLCKRPCALVDVAAAMLPVSRPAVAQHLKVLEQAGLVSQRRDRKVDFYAVNGEMLAVLKSYFSALRDLPPESNDPLLRAAVPSWRRFRRS